MSGQGNPARFGRPDQAPTATVGPAGRFPPPRAAALLVFDMLMALGAAAAMSSLALEFGFYKRLVPVAYLHGVQGAVLALFVVDRFLRLAHAGDRRAFLKENWIDFAVMAAGAVAAVLGAAKPMEFQVLAAATVYVVAIELYVLLSAALRAAGAHLPAPGRPTPPRRRPILVVLGIYATTVLVGAGLLMLPKAAAEGHPLSSPDALFAATSAACLCGLSVRPVSELTVFGQTVILGLFQVGGLAIMILASILAVVIGQRLVAGPAPPDPGAPAESPLLPPGSPNSMGRVWGPLEAAGGIGRIARLAALATLALEVAGAAVMYPMWRGVDAASGKAAGGAVQSALHAAFASFFHSASAFCNAGFTLQADSLMGFRGNWPTIGVMAPLVLLGGLGFPVLYDLARRGQSAVESLLKLRAPGPRGLSLHSRLVLAATAAVIVLGTVVLLTVEHNSDKGGTFGAPIAGGGDERPEPILVKLPGAERLKESVIETVSARTGGFATVSQNALSEGGKLWVIVLMIIGGAPAGTAGGLKLGAVVILVLTAWAALRRGRVVGFGRVLPASLVRKVVILAGLYLLLVLALALVLCCTMSGRRLASGLEPTGMQLVFEAASACGTVGLSCGVTDRLTLPGKLAEIAGMLLGRVGPLVLLLALLPRQAEEQAQPEEIVLA